ncbi:EZH inhibitory protein [Neomonachus schauinslandi]|uniref:EZH inhibitory protein n=1 Tax=Neomonachus schauinslandi TaxID=29088 RepID=A0A8M1M103_NEOSC|nr:EZH inhibitory protein [Neomonachus schauinslandi]
MDAPSSDQKAQKEEQGEVPEGLKNEVAPAPSDARGAGNPDPSALVPSVSSGLSPSGGGAPQSGTAGSSASALAAVGAISINGEGPELPSTGCVQERERADLQGGRSPHAKLRCVVPGAGLGLQASHAGGVAAMVQAMRGVGQASGPPTLTASPGRGRGRKQPGRKEAAQAQKPPERRCLFPALPTAQCPVPLPPPSSPGSQPSGRRRSRASPSGHASQPGPALRSQARAPGPALRSQAASRRRASAPGPARRGRASAPGPAYRNRASAPGPAYRNRASSSRASGLGSATIITPAHRALLSAAVHPALRRLVYQSSSSSPDPEVPSLGAQPRWHAVRMRASSPSPPGRLFPFPAQYGESSSSSSSTSSSGSSGQSPSSSSSSSYSSTNFSGQSTSSPKCSGLGSISTPSPASLRRALLPELEALSPLSPGEEAETGSVPSSPTLQWCDNCKRN